MIFFGLAEVVTSFTHSFFGITTSPDITFTITASVIGGFYIAAGLLILTMRKLAATIAIVLLVLDILGRITLVISGLYPLNSSEQVIGILMGTTIAALFAIYIGMKRKLFI
jgi:hypothetical protein